MRGGQQRNDAETETLIPTIGGVFSYGIQANIIGRQDHNGGNGIGVSAEIDPTLTKADQHGVAVVPTLTSNGDAHSSFRDEHGLVACFKGGQGSAAGGIGYSETLSPTLSAAESGSNRVPSLMIAQQVRRLTPVECARLQGFPDDYLDIQYRGKPAVDGPKYKALGNSMAVPVMAWIGKRIQMVEDFH